MSAGQAADTFAATALQTLQTSPQTLAEVGNVMQISPLQTILHTYRQLLANHLQRLPADSTLESGIRAQGHLASQLAESLTLQERSLLNTAIADAKWAQVLGVGILSALLVLIAWLLDRSVITPMKRLMADLTPIAEGHFERLDVRARSTEMVSLREAFNRLLDELEARRLIQSEKLAALGVLVSLIERGVALARGRELTLLELAAALAEQAIRTLPDTQGDLPTLAEREEEYIRYVLEHSNGNRTRAAQVLGIDRVSLWRKLKKYGLAEGEE